MSIGTIIKNHRGERTLATISAETGISLAMLSLIEQDKRNPSETTLQALAKAFGTTAYNLRFEIQWGVSWESFGESVRAAGPRRQKQILANPSLAK